jgi:hypothetical protein
LENASKNKKTDKVSKISRDSPSKPKAARSLSKTNKAKQAATAKVASDTQSQSLNSTSNEQVNAGLITNETVNNPNEPTTQAPSSLILVEKEISLENAKKVRQF